MNKYQFDCSARGEVKRIGRGGGVGKDRMTLPVNVLSAYMCEVSSPVQDDVRADEF